MSNEILERQSLYSQTSSQRVPGLIVSSTLAFATLAAPLSLNNLPTYIPPNVSSELIGKFFAIEQENVDKQKLLYTIRSYSTYEKNWDGYEGVPPKNKTISDTTHFLKHLPDNIKLPYAGLSGDGEINLFWDKDSIYIDIGFLGNNKFSYYARDNSGKEISGDDIVISDTLPTELINLIKTISI